MLLNRSSRLSILRLHGTTLELIVRDLQVSMCRGMRLIQVSRLVAGQISGLGALSWQPLLGHVAVLHFGAARYLTLKLG